MFHVGGARSALQNWIYAKQHDGVFVLRIEDTDAARNRPEWTEGIINALDWIGIRQGSYEGPHFQSSYAEQHREAAERLRETGQAYYCDCTRDEIQARIGNAYGGYDGYCRDRGLTPGPGRALRFRTPDEGQTVVEDLIRGTVVTENSTIEDFVIARADGSPVFLLANVVDDAAMNITHVIRAEEHLPNTPKQQLLWQALGHRPPVWAHVPVVVNAKRPKLSKRRDKVALESYRDEGYLAGAMRNYLMLLGWAPSGNREIVPWSVIESEFRLEDVNSSSAFFDEKKLRAFNGEYIRALTPAEFIEATQPWLHGWPVTGSEQAAGPAGEAGQAPGVAAPPWAPGDYDPKAYEAVAPLAQTRITLLSEIVQYVDFLFLPEPAIDETAWTKVMKDGAADLLGAAVAAFEVAPWDADSLKTTLEAVGAEHGLKLGRAQAPVRVAVTGRPVGLPLFESLEVLGRERTQARLRAALSRLSAPSP
jgi:glutamyl-tRNA synthetase